MNILDLKFYSNDLEKEVTVREFFFELLKTLWIEQEGFSGKRPFGNSGWDGNLIVCLIKNKLVSGEIDLVHGELDEDGYLEIYDSAEVDEFVINMILKPLFFKDDKNYIENNNQESLNNSLLSGCRKKIYGKSR